MVLGLVTAIIDPVLSSIHFAGPEITFNELWSVFLTVCALMFLCWKAPSLAGSLLGGSPYLGADHLLQAASAPIATGIAAGAVAGRVASSVSATRAAAALPRSGLSAGSQSASVGSTFGSSAGAGAGEGRASGGVGGAAGPGDKTPAGADASLVLSSMGKSVPGPASAAQAIAGV
jgi:type IV secretion system protein TrbL